MEDEEFESTEIMDLGPCCGCRQVKSNVRNLMMIHKLAPVPGTGWGNVVYGWPSNGALAVLCDECAEKEAPLLDAISGLPANKGRVPYETLEGEFGNDATLDAAIYDDSYDDEDDEPHVPIVLFGVNENDEVTGMVNLSEEHSRKLAESGE